MTKALVFRIRLNKNERELLTARAASAGMKDTAYVRSLLFPKSIVATKLAKAPAEKIGQIVATKEPIKKLIKPKVYKSTAEVMKEFKPAPDTVKQSKESYRRFAEPGALLKK